MTNTEKTRIERPATLVEQLRAVETYDERVALRIAEFDVGMRGEEWIPEFCALQGYVSRGQLPKVDVAKTQRGLIDECCKSNRLLRGIITNRRPEYGVVPNLEVLLANLGRNYANPVKNRFPEDLVIPINDFGHLISGLPQPITEGWYFHGRNLIGSATAATAGVALSGVVSALPKFNTDYDLSSILIAGSGLAGLLTLITAGGFYASDKGDKNEALKSLDQAHDRLLPNAQYLDGKIEELFGGSR